MSTRKWVVALAATLCCTATMFANANDLIINNRTDLDSASVINHGLCSDRLGEVGITRAHTENHVVPSSIIKIACTFGKHPCRADVYMSANCAAPKIATILFDIDTGIVGVPKSDDPRFILSGSGFSFTLEQK
jgi:hypothetical protein